LALDMLSANSRADEALGLLQSWSSQLTGYRIERLVGTGGFSCVFLGHQISLGRSVAIKVLFADAPNAAAIDGQLKREGKGIASLRHSNIIQVIDFGTAEGRPYLVLDYVDAPSLEELLKDGPLSPADAIQIAKQCAAALEHAHARGVIHRDIKPSNVLVDEHCHAWVLDFGIASLRQSHLDLRATQATLAQAGSISYMAPERFLANADPSPAEDIYALGAVLYEMLMGFPPHGAFPPVRVDESPAPRLNAFLTRALAHDPAQRWESASAFSQGLEAIGIEQNTKPKLDEAESQAKQPQYGRNLWLAMLGGGAFFVSLCFFIAFSAEERFSLPAGPASKLYDDAIALLISVCVIAVAWTFLLWQGWVRCRHQPQPPSASGLLITYGCILFCTALVVFLAVKD
jgi:serine/threonine protein kinase